MRKHSLFHAQQALFELRPPDGFAKEAESPDAASLSKEPVAGNKKRKIV